MAWSIDFSGSRTTDLGIEITSLDGLPATRSDLEHIEIEVSGGTGDCEVTTASGRTFSVLIDASDDGDIWDSDEAMDICEVA